MGILTVLSASLGLSPAPLVAQALSPTEIISPSPRSSRRSAVGTRISAGVIADTDHNAEVRGDLWYGRPGLIGIAQKMMRDPHVRQSVDDISTPLVAATWRFQPVSKAPLDIEVARFLTWAFFGRLPWDRILRELIVQRYAANGFALCEMTDDVAVVSRTRFPMHPGSGRGILPTGLHEIPANTVKRWVQRKENTAQLASIEQWIQGGDVEVGGFRTIDADRILRWTFDQEGANFTGLAVLRSAYQPWKLKIAFLTLDAIKHERYAAGTPMITAAEDASDEDLDAAEAILADMRVNAKGFIVLPSGYKFEWTGAGEDHSTNINEAIERCNKDIAFNVGAGFKLLGLSGKTGSYALGSTQQGQHHLSIVTHAKKVAEAINKGCDGWSPAERIKTLNYGADIDLPECQALNLPTRDWQEVAKTTFEGVRTGTLTADDPLEDQLRESLQLPPRDPDTARTNPQGVTAKTDGKEPNQEDQLA